MPPVIRFEQPIYLYALWSLPIFLLIFWYIEKKQLINRKIWNNAVIYRSFFDLFQKYIFILTAFILLIVAAANPQSGLQRRTTEQKSVDIFIAFDISQSMMASDVPPNRLEKARKFLLQLLPSLAGNRVGLIIFAGGAYLQMPLTYDFANAALLIKSINCDMISNQGTAIGAAILLAKKSFPQSEKVQQTLIIVSDGESHDDDAVATATAAHKDGMAIFTLGVGTAEGGFIPYYFGGQESYKRDKTNNPIVSKLDKNVLSSISAASGGTYQSLQNNQEATIETLKNAIKKSVQQATVVSSYEAQRSLFPYLVGLAMLLLLIENFLRKRTKNNISNKYLILILLIFVTEKSQAQESHFQLREGDKNYEAQKYGAAEKNYRSATDLKNTTKAKYNLGNSLYKQERYAEAVLEYETAAAEKNDKTLTAKALYNQGNAFFQEKKYDKSIDAFQKSLKLTPNDNDAKHNLALAKRQLRQQKAKSDHQKGSQQELPQNPSPNEQKKDTPIDNTSKKEKKKNQAAERTLNKKEAETLLQIMDGEEQKVQQKLRKTPISRSRKSEKDW